MKVTVCREAELPPGSVRKVEAGASEIAVFNTGSGYCALDDTCTHAGASLSEGRLDGCRLVCGWHGAEFECDGKLAKFPAKIADLSAYPVSVEAGEVTVEVGPKVPAAG